METSLKKYSLKDWFLAARPKTLSTAIVPFLGGTLLALASGYPIQWSLLLFAWASAVCIQIGTNFINDAYDFSRGADTKVVLGPQRATRSGLLSGGLSFRFVASLGWAFYLLALIFGIPLIEESGWAVFFVLVLSLLAGFLYTGGSYPLAYHGLGDIFVFLFYGIVSTNAAYWMQTERIDASSILLAAQIGCLCTSMIAINNLRDVQEDKKAAKKTLAVQFGVVFGRIEIICLLALPFLLNFLWPWNAVVWLPFCSFPLAFRNMYNVCVNEPGEKYNAFLALSGVNMLAFCCLQGIGFAFVYLTGV